MTGSGKGPGAGAPSPALGADPAGAVGGELEISQRDQAPVGGSRRVSGCITQLSGDDRVPGGKTDNIRRVREGIPVDLHMETVISGPHAVLGQITAVFGGQNGYGCRHLSAVFVCDGNSDGLAFLRFSGIPEPAGYGLSLYAV